MDINNSTNNLNLSFLANLSESTNDELRQVNQRPNPIDSNLGLGPPIPGAKIPISKRNSNQLNPNIANFKALIEQVNDELRQVNQSPNPIDSNLGLGPPIPGPEISISKRNSKQLNPNIANFKALIEQVKTQTERENISREDAIKRIISLAQNQPGRTPYTGNYRSTELSIYLEVSKTTYNRYISKAFGNITEQCPNLANLKALIEQVKSQTEEKIISRENAIKSIISLAQNQPGRTPYTGNYTILGLARYLKINRSTCEKYISKEFGAVYSKKDAIANLQALIKQFKSQTEGENISREDALKRITLLAQSQPGRTPYTGSYTSAGLAEYFGISTTTARKNINNAFGAVYSTKDEIANLQSLIKQVKSQTEGENISKEDALKRITLLAQSQPGRTPYTGRHTIPGVAKYLGISQSTVLRSIKNVFLDFTQEEAY